MKCQKQFYIATFCGLFCLYFQPWKVFQGAQTGRLSKEIFKNQTPRTSSSKMFVGNILFLKQLHIYLLFENVNRNVNLRQYDSVYVFLLYKTRKLNKITQILMIFTSKYIHLVIIFSQHMPTNIYKEPHTISVKYGPHNWKFLNVFQIQ